MLLVGRWIGTNIYASKNLIVVSGDDMRRGYARVNGSFGRSYDEIEGIAVSVSRNFNVLSEISTGKEVNKLECLNIAEVVDMDIEVASNDEFMRGGGCMGKKR